MIKWPAANVWGMRWSFHTSMNWSSNCDRSSSEDQRWQDSPRGHCADHQPSSASFKIIGDHQRSSVSFNIIKVAMCSSSAYQQWSAQSYWASTVIKMTMLKHETHLRCRVNISLVGIMPERYISQTSLNLRITHNILGPIFMLGLPTTPSAIISMCMSKYPRADHGDNVQISFCRASIFSAWLSNLWLVDICWIFYNKLSFVDQKQWSSDQSILITMLMLGCHWL